MLSFRAPLVFVLLLRVVHLPRNELMTSRWYMRGRGPPKVPKANDCERSPSQEEANIAKRKATENACNPFLAMWLSFATIATRKAGRQILDSLYQSIHYEKPKYLLPEHYLFYDC
jgi:hypothetical protein